MIVIKFLKDWNNVLSAQFNNHYAKGELLEVNDNQLFKLLEIHNRTVQLDTYKDFPMVFEIHKGNHTCTLNDFRN